MSDKRQFAADSDGDLLSELDDMLKFSGQLAYNDWVFNAWGNKYEALKKDDSIPSRLERVLNVPNFAPGVVMEGGSIEVNGAGVVLTTEQCLLNRNRNPHLNRQQIEDYLKAYLGVQKVLWLAEGSSATTPTATLTISLVLYPRRRSSAPWKEILRTLTTSFCKITWRGCDA